MEHIYIICRVINKEQIMYICSIGNLRISRVIKCSKTLKVAAEFRHQLLERKRHYPSQIRVNRRLPDNCLAPGNLFRQPKIANFIVLTRPESDRCFCRVCLESFLEFLKL